MTSRRIVSAWGLVALIWALLGLEVLAAPTQSQVAGSWTMNGFYRSCSSVDNMCSYAFEVDENTGLNTDRVACFIDVTGPEETDFFNQPCNPRFVVNAGWDKSQNDGPGNGTGASTPKSFVTIVVTDLALSAYAFFGYREDQIGDFKTEAPKLTSPAFPVGTFGDRDWAGPETVSPAWPQPAGKGGAGLRLVEPPVQGGSGLGIVAARVPGAANLAGPVSREQKSLQILRLNRLWDAPFRSIFLSFTINEAGTGVRVVTLRYRGGIRKIRMERS
ncbi:hypothetical protein B0H67DRAFT_171375 [Lasiosphaeris hirsuta]|uniref:Uncharacterized protein n=1 Tax=Lasiosphaeris hirsuta TaxID=260670 RepID=A0AA40AQ86_9PEZI|nr:hypothetical protein B0H67DRAFT_171375 [Lasiosphaeris hirsuta]